jgi:16S rRNA (adenine1518-N6/adenine1519-N6)-dimethyltransferase
VPQKFGQHFLTNGAILDRIARAVCPEGEDLVVEIGPGKGALTQKLLQRSGRVVAIELDPAMVEILHRKFDGETRLQIIHADILHVDLAQWGAVPIAGNLPYYVATPILEKAVRAGSPRAVFLIQKEVASRLVARPGEKEYGYLTLQTALFADTKLLFDVKPGAFQPPPKVDSSVVQLSPHGRDYGVNDREAFLKFLSHSFRQKRKTLRNNLFAVYGKEQIDAWPEAGLRAEQIPIEKFAEMFRRLAPQA